MAHPGARGAHRGSTPCVPLKGLGAYDPPDPIHPGSLLK